MQTEISYLIHLQAHDSAIVDLEEAAEALNPKIQQKKKQIQVIKDGLKNSKEALKKHQLKKKELEKEAEAKEALIAKHQGELNTLKSNDAYKAMLGEIEAAKKDLSKIEDEELELMEEVEKDEKESKAVEQKAREEEQKVQAEMKAIKDKQDKILSDVQAKKKERIDYAKTVPQNLASQYEALRLKRGGIAIVPLEGNSCGGCRMNLTPNFIGSVKANKNMILCESCNRILYWPGEEVAQRK